MVDVESSLLASWQPRQSAFEGISALVQKGKNNDITATTITIQNRLYEFTAFFDFFIPIMIPADLLYL
jgi:hypothetical protein